MHRDLLMKYMQITTLVMLTLLGFFSLPSAWISLAPEIGFLSFLSQTSVLSPIITVITTSIAVWAFILGWDPTQDVLKKIRAIIILGMFTSIRSMVRICVICGIGLIVLVFHFYSITRDKSEIIDLVLQENYDAADLELAKENMSPTEFADLYVIVNAIRQLTRKAGQAGDQAECRIYVNYLSNRNMAFISLWNRYLLLQAKSACLQVLDNPAEAVSELEKARKLTRWLSRYESRRISRMLARLYLEDKNGSAGIKDKGERLQRVITLISTDADRSAIRMFGSARFEQGDYSQAIELWIKSLASETNPMEVKKLKNNIALAYSSISQPRKALEFVKSAIDIPFLETEEDQRREQIRLLSTAASIEASDGRCKEANTYWELREKILRQSAPKCAWLIKAQVNVCSEQEVLSQEQREVVISSLLYGIGQEANDFKDRTSSAIKELIKQADLRFKSCYVGLNFQPDLMVEKLVL
jgi:tetratricopeptide (TPR) repeat protein